MPENDFPAKHLPSADESGLASPSLLIRSYLDQMARILEQVDELRLEACLEALWEAWESDRTVFIIGNGGSASTASHMATDLGKQTQVPGRRPLRAHSLTDNVELITALANDTDYSRIFAEQLRIHARPGDLLICISCSGNSPNVIAAVQEARRLGLRTIAFGGSDGGQMRTLTEVYLHVPSSDYGAIESAHLIFEHCMTTLLFQYGKRSSANRRTVLVDRDGVIITNRDDYVKSWEEVELIPGAIEALARLHQSGHRVFVVTNQSAIGRGLVTAVEVDMIHDQLRSLIAVGGGHVEAFLVCPHGPDDACLCRKPSPGLLHQARDRFGVDLEKAVVIGDHETDLLAAAAAGCDSILVLTGRTAAGAKNGLTKIADDLAAAVELILKGANASNGHTAVTAAS
jgi:D-glycero-D-manno-heptose 1,7-bisphosphate phosphatase